MVSLSKPCLEKKKGSSKELKYLKAVPQTKIRHLIECETEVRASE